MADFFDISVDVLLGYEVTGQSPGSDGNTFTGIPPQKGLGRACRGGKALQKHPHSFQIVTESAALYRAFGIEAGDKKLLRRALELLEQSRLLLSQNKDPQISEQTIYGNIAQTYLGLGETDKAIELWKAHNADGVNSSQIG